MLPNHVFRQAPIRENTSAALLGGYLNWPAADTD